MVAALLAIYFSLTLYFFPTFYISQPPASKALPVITNVKLTTFQDLVGKSLEMSVTSTNQGDTADIQIVSISFPNLTGFIRNEYSIRIKNHNFTQNPIFVETGDNIGSNYSGLSGGTAAKYPSIEFFSRPWKADMNYQAHIELKPSFLGRFMIFVKSVSLPHIDEFSHYPRTGIKDQQAEFVDVYSVDVEKD